MEELEKVESKVNYLINISLLAETEEITSHQISLFQRMALNKYKAVTIEEYAESIDKSREISRRDLKDLLEKGLLKEEKKGKKFIYFLNSKELRNKVHARLEEKR